MNDRAETVLGTRAAAACHIGGLPRRPIFAVSVLLGVILAAGAAMRAQQAPAAAPTAQSAIPAETLHISNGVLRAQSQIVRIDVEVTDSKGRPVLGLRPDQFTITDNGKIEKISAFSYADIERMETAGPENTEPMVVPLDNAGPNVRPAEQEAISNEIHNRRMIVLFFDQSTMATDDLLRAHAAADKFVKQQMTPADLVAVVTFGTRLSILMNFTNDRAALDKAIAAIVPGAPSQLANPLSAGAQNGEYDVQQDTGAAYTADETEFNVFNTDQKLEAIENLTEVLAGIPGRKALVEFTGGITQTGEENRAELRAATDAANRADVSIYSIDARGLFATAPGGDATATAASGKSMFSGASVFHQTDQRQDSRDTLATLSADTGGRAFFDLGDLSDAFPKIESENSGYYLVGYTLPAGVKRDGSWHSVRVKVNAPGVHVRYRNGYYAPRDFQHLEKEDREQQLAEAMNSDDPEVDLPVAVETGMFRISDQQTYVPVAAKISSSALDWAKKHDRREAAFDFAAQVRAVPSGQIVAELRDTITVHLDEQRYEQVSHSPLVYQGGVVLAAGTYRLKFVAREDESGRIGTFEQPLNIPSRAPTRMSLSSVLLSSQLVPAEKSGEVRTQEHGLRARLAASPLEVQGQKIIPSVTRFFNRGQTLYVFFQAYLPEKNAKSGVFDAGTLRGGLVFFRSGVQVNSTPLLAPTEIDARSHTASFRLSIPLEKLPDGRYTVQAIAIAAGTQQSAFGRAYFALEQAPGGGAQATPTAVPSATRSSSATPSN